MRKLALLLVLCLSFLMVGCLKAEQSHVEETAEPGMVKEAVSEIKKAWKDEYSDESYKGADGYFEIKNTRVLKLRKNDMEELNDVEYIVEFVLFVDYFHSAPYYDVAPVWDNVLVYKDGSMKAASHVIRTCRAKAYTTGAELIDSVIDYGDKFNCVEKLK